MALPTRPDIFLSRVLHLSSTSVLIAAVVAPLLFDSVGKLNHVMLMPLAAVVALITGFYNSFMLNPKPSRMARPNEKIWKIIVHLKVLLILGSTPLLNYMPPHLIQPIRFTLTILGVLMGSYAKFYREKHQAVAH